MAKFAPNIYHLFNELPVPQRFEAVAELGFDAVEWHFPYQLPLTELRAIVQATGVRVEGALTPIDWAVEKGIAGQPGRESDFYRAVDTALEYAAVAGFVILHPGPGQVPVGVSREACLDVFRRNLDYVCRAAEGTGVTIVIEGVSQARFPNYVIQTIGQAAQLVREVGRDNLKVCYDPYHLVMQEPGSLTQILHQYWPLIGYCQIRNSPLPHEPGVGEIDLDFIIGQYDALGYDKWIGLEFDPSQDSWASLLWASRYGYPVKPRAETRFALARSAAA